MKTEPTRTLTYHETDLTDLRHAADQARAAYRWEAALGLYTRALEQADNSAEVEYELRSNRAICYGYLGDYAKEVADLEEMGRLAETLGDVARQVAVFNRQAQVRLRSGDLVGSRALAETALARAREAGEGRLVVDSLNELNWVAEELGDLSQAQSGAEQALRLARTLDYRAGEADALYKSGWLQARLGRHEQGRAQLEAALVLYRQLGDREGEARCLNGLGLASQDLARSRDYYEQALVIYQATRNTLRQAVIFNNLGSVHERLGLYRRARDYQQQALQLKRALHGSSDIVGNLANLTYIYLMLKAYERAQKAVDEMLALARERGQRSREVYALFLRGRIALGRGLPAEARVHLQQAVEGWAALGEPGGRAHALAWLGAAELALGQVEEARTHTAQAVATLETTDVKDQEVWWWRYRALQGQSAVGGQSAADEAWQVLDRARELMLEGIATLSDAGLRRNYLNKASINQDITLEWTWQAVRRGLAPVSFLAHEISPVGLQDQLQRLVGIGNRLTAQRDPETLPRFILDEFVELSGAEQAFIALRDDASGELSWVSRLGIPDEAVEEVKAVASHVLEQAQTNWQPIQCEVEGEVPPDGVPALHRRSVVAVPMVSQGTVWGLLFGAMRQIFGRFSQADLDLLSLLANQAAAALENARWTRTLERRVEERTAKLASLAEVGRDIAATLDLDTVLTRITENARELLKADTSSVYLLQPDCKTLRLIACAGPVPESVKATTLQLGQGITGYVAQSGVAEIIADTSRDPRTMGTADGTAASETGKMVVAPLFSRGQVMGAMTGWRLAEAMVFQQADLDFLVALARQVVIAIENARLFAATEQARLETEQAWLEAEVAREEAELAREAAEAARMDAERANRAKSAFLANMSHELRTPLNAIMGFTRIVRRKAEGVMPERQVDNLDKVLVSAEHLLRLINTVLDIAKIEAGHMDVKLAEFDPAKLAEMCLMTAQPLVRRGVALEKKIVAPLPRMVSDQDKIKQIVINLLSNAAKFTHQGRILVTVTQENEYIAFTVSDTGIGIAEEALLRVFEDFQQAEHDTRQKYGGTGLGLPISRSLARMLGGDLTATSVLGEGSTFTLTLPARFKIAVGEPGAE